MTNSKNETYTLDGQDLTFKDFKNIVIRDYTIAYESRQASLLGRKEVLTGKAKFGIFGDGKEVAQIAMAKVFQKGDYRAGYYRDQTFMFASGMSNVYEFFAQLYAIPDVNLEPASAGRSMNGHFGTRSINADGTWKKLTDMKNCSSDISPTGGQMPRLLGLAYASKLYRQNKKLSYLNNFSINGNEVAFGTIGNASTSEGHFFETINAAGVLQVPMVISVWDDEYGISVHAEHQTTKQNISEVLKGFQRDELGKGFEIFRVNGWDYAALCETYERASKIARIEHVPVLVHVQQMTQPQGHSTSGSHERYKSKDRLSWEENFDCLKQMREWLISSAIAKEEELIAIEEKCKIEVKEIQKKAWADFNEGILVDKNYALPALEELAKESKQSENLSTLIKNIQNTKDVQHKDIVAALKAALRITVNENLIAKEKVKIALNFLLEINFDRYNSFLFTDTSESALKVPIIPAVYEENPKLLDGREILNACFDANFERDPRIVAFGEDVGQIGDVNQGFSGLQLKYGEERIIDTGIREATIMGQGIGLALRGLKPIAEIQYLDYLLFGLQTLSDDLASLSYRTKAGQKAPMIIRTRGHRLEGIWHSGSPIGMIINSLRGIHVLVPRNMTQAAGFYNTVLRSDEPALIIECLNGYRLKEKLPTNIGDFTIPLGVPEIIKEGADITLVTYGSCCRIAMDGIKMLEEFGISVELIDVQTLLPFDKNKSIVESLKKTNRVLFLDEDVPGGATAFMMQEVLENQKGYQYLDAAPKTLTAKAHRPPYGSDGDYFTKPSADDVFDAIYEMMRESNPTKFNNIY